MNKTAAKKLITLRDRFLTNRDMSILYKIQDIMHDLLENATTPAQRSAVLAFDTYARLNVLD